MWSKVGFNIEIVGSISSRCKVVISGFPLLSAWSTTGFWSTKSHPVAIVIRLEDSSKRLHEERKDRCNAITRGRWAICLARAKQMGTDPGCIRYYYRGDFRYRQSSSAPWCPSGGICASKVARNYILVQRKKELD